VARALLVGCGCRGRTLGEALIAAGWQVRGTTRDPAAAAGIEAAGIEPAVADLSSLGDLFGLIGDVALVYWLLGSARGPDDELSALHGPRLEHLLQRLVDTPVRGFVYEAAGTVAPEHLDQGRRVVSDAADRWRIPVEVVTADAGDWPAWRGEMVAAAGRALGG
jgi:uncharacterized protein YbjT (DUF2867 family)